MTGDGGRVFGTQVYSGCRSGAWPTSEREGSHQESEEPLAWMRGLLWGRAGGRCQGGCRGALSPEARSPGPGIHPASVLHGRGYDSGGEPALWLLPGFCSLGEWADSGKQQGPGQALVKPCPSLWPR